ncbi:phosphoribosyl-AMP cyclohydrolase [Flavobacterium cheongpyeongense]|uniref:Histidine biosynthesis bifunctional protein HisIE n=1 Tax=Flavobacterium cheongpyeongense TaxID=2212651 RepID=A0A2V4BSP0_9FLAO|nr:phosphoribosyl-AMP cyclohydrolase [Flavobacterium cheongpyeongense]PXY42116.1 phosphoribosyl-AMP cyclohydrolase [Flavobacterium cheongpyeongense]
MKTGKNELEETQKLLLQFEKRGGLLPVAVQETQTEQLLMLASVNQEALEITLKTQKATFWSTSKNEIWTKGLTSGNTLRIDEILVDCDQDAIVYKVTLEKGGVCHTYNEQGKNRKACFYRKLDFNNHQLNFLEK